jgi:hypothetical protein
MDGNHPVTQLPASTKGPRRTSGAEEWREGGGQESEHDHSDRKTGALHLGSAAFGCGFFIVTMAMYGSIA